MAEYIVEYPDYLVDEEYVQECINVHERIVRCKDCEYYSSYFGLCNHPLIDGGFEGDVYLDVEPDGFCAWGERRDERI